MKDFSEDFARIFAGLSRSSGRYVVPDDAVPDEHGKLLGPRWTSTEPVTPALWRAHLSGEPTTLFDEERGRSVTGALGLGIVPIRDDGTVVFGAIDVDVYPLDLDELRRKVEALRLPLILCRTKSGGAHLYLFLRGPTKASLVVERLTEWAIALGHPGVEVFPKQVSLTEHSKGSWINLPYSGGDRSVRYAIGPNGSLTVEEFVAEVGRRAIAAEALEAFELPEDDAADDSFEGGPPCLQALARTGFGDWGNNGLFNVAVYLKKRHGEGWDHFLPEYNDRFEGLGLPARDLGTIAKSVKKRDYFYKCKDQPLAPVCNRAACLKRPYGIGGAGDPGVVFGEMLKVETDPVTWVWSVDGADVECSTADLMDQRRFRVLIVEKLSKMMRPVKPDAWAKIVEERIARAEVVGVPEDGTREGQFWAHLAAFCTGRARARNLDEILMDKAYTDPRAKRVYFRSTSFYAYLTAHRFAGLSERDAWRWLRRGGAEHHEATMKGKLVNYWSVPAFPEQTEEHDVPKAEKVEM